MRQSQIKNKVHKTLETIENKIFVKIIKSEVIEVLKKIIMENLYYFKYRGMYYEKNCYCKESI